jgi:hypothetical protein
LGWLLVAQSVRRWTSISIEAPVTLSTVGPVDGGPFQRSRRSSIMHWLPRSRVGSSVVGGHPANGMCLSLGKRLELDM